MPDLPEPPPPPAPPPPQTPEILSQSAIDDLMGEAIAASQSAVIKPNGERFAKDANVRVETYDFRNPAFLTEIEMRQVRIRHEQFIHYLSARLSMFLRMDIALKMSSLHTEPYNKFTEAIPNPTFINLFKLEELSGVGILDMSPRLAMTVVDRVLGGKGHSVRMERYLTELEMALMDDVIQIILEEWCRQWSGIRELDVTLVGRENNGRFLQTAAHDAIMLVLSVEATVGDCSEPIQFGIPYYTIEPLIKKMQAINRKHNRLNDSEKRGEWRGFYGEVDVPLTAEWDAFELTVADLLTLREGDVVELPIDLISNTNVRLYDTPKYLAEMGLQNGQVSLRINEVLQPAEATL